MRRACARAKASAWFEEPQLREEGGCCGPDGCAGQSARTGVAFARFELNCIPSVVVATLVVDSAEKEPQARHLYRDGG